MDLDQFGHLLLRSTWFNASYRLVQVIAGYGTVTNTSAAIMLTARIRYPISVEYFDLTGKAIAVRSNATDP